MFNSTLEIIIKARDEASQTMSNMTSKLKSMEPAFKKMAAAGTVAFGAIAAVSVSALKESAAAAADMSIANTTLENSLKSLSGSAMTELQKQAGSASNSLKFLQGSMEGASKAALKLGFDDEAAAKSFAKLFQVTKSTTEAHKELQVAMDMARARGISLEDATQKLIMVHSGATKALKAEGLAIDENATALENINALASTFAGQAANYAGTAAGQFDILKENMNNVKQAVGDALAPALTKALEAVTPLIEKFSAWAAANPELLSKIVLIGGAVSALVAVVGTLGMLLPAIIAGFTVLAGPVGIIIALVGTLFWAVKKIVDIFTLLRDHSTEVWTGLKIMFKETIDSIVRFFDPLVNVINRVAEALSRVGEGVAGVAKSVGSKISNAFSGKRAQGGNVSSGSSYLVGESGPEIFTPGGSGYVTPNNRMTGGQNFIVNINGGQYLSEDAALDMGDKIFKALQTQLRGA